MKHPIACMLIGIAAQAFAGDARTTYVSLMVNTESPNLGHNDPSVAEVTTEFKRELRALPNVEITNVNPDWRVYVAVSPLRINADQDNAIAISIAVLAEQPVKEYLQRSQEPGMETARAMLSGNCGQMSLHDIEVGPIAKIQTMVRSLVATLDNLLGMERDLKRQLEH